MQDQGSPDPSSGAGSSGQSSLPPVLHALLQPPPPPPARSAIPTPPEHAPAPPDLYHHHHHHHHEGYGTPDRWDAGSVPPDSSSASPATSSAHPSISSSPYSRRAPSIGSPASTYALGTRAMGAPALPSLHGGGAFDPERLHVAPAYGAPAYGSSGPTRYEGEAGYASYGLGALQGPGVGGWGDAIPHGWEAGQSVRSAESYARGGVYAASARRGEAPVVPGQEWRAGLRQESYPPVYGAVPDMRASREPARTEQQPPASSFQFSGRGAQEQQQSYEFTFQGPGAAQQAFAAPQRYVPPSHYGFETGAAAHEGLRLRTRGAGDEQLSYGHAMSASLLGGQFEGAAGREPYEDPSQSFGMGGQASAYAGPSTEMYSAGEPGDPGPGPSTLAARRRARPEKDDEDEDYSEGEGHGGKKARGGKKKVEIACYFCRQRKLKCSGDRPTCKTCSRQKKRCEYAQAPRRRGPGKAPRGSRRLMQGRGGANAGGGGGGGSGGGSGGVGRGAGGNGALPPSGGLAGEVAAEAGEPSSRAYVSAAISLPTLPPHMGTRSDPGSARWPGRKGG
ncbi:hypothetical protein K488DRAFT_82078 [Vararia minispora EC-137]|uniref:Uncharacterized protein n=1 Tax=Vararia minispora EC-137 TaxID=1314806 RepID=A0ACB8QXC1_9AGAM|nr:hypothetical protein K488DRAFT_82078 [Vararia minispora EC-137]